MTPREPAVMLDWAVAGRPMAGEAESGDLYIVRPVGRGILLGVVDGLGHGAEAAAAARAAVSILERHSKEPLVQLMRQVHAALRGTRGVVMSLAFLDGTANSLTWLGVGNVEGVLVSGSTPKRSKAALLASGGIVGSALPRLQSQVFPLPQGATLIFASDGIRSGFADDLSTESTVQQLADQILARHGKDTDDAMVLVARFGGAEPSSVARAL